MWAISSFQEQDLTKEAPTIKNNTIEELKAKLVNKEVGKFSEIFAFACVLQNVIMFTLQFYALWSIYYTS